MKRQTVSKKTRFEVFKRDAFTCQYCGAHPPGVLLHVDHIHPVAEGGTNEIDNLVTACEPCNAGKGARLLNVAPETLAQKAAQVAEREAQLQGYAEILEAKRQRLDADAWRVLEVRYGKDVKTAPRTEITSIKRFIEKLGVHEVLEAMDIAMGSRVSEWKVFRYFCGVCWNKVREQEGGAD
ncbi:HNH endonuclease [Xenophilus sp. Marseille-Q4582]|uniref:HNH endonuclease n=1 Tax=Xenophilus sp. Marseille-Q4582 TaxID=2866600 RepID=UPI001CE3E350|nr:HNH endonuclease [Xenophilus sp. Marseille-Q4582]